MQLLSVESVVASSLLFSSPPPLLANNAQHQFSISGVQTIGPSPTVFLKTLHSWSLDTALINYNSTILQFEHTTVPLASLFILFVSSPWNLIGSGLCKIGLVPTYPQGQSGKGDVWGVFSCQRSSTASLWGFCCSHISAFLDSFFYSYLMVSLHVSVTFVGVNCCRQDLN